MGILWLSSTRLDSRNGSIRYVQYKIALKSPDLVRTFPPVLHRKPSELLGEFSDQAQQIKRARTIQESEELWLGRSKQQERGQVDSSIFL